MRPLPFLLAAMLQAPLAVPAQPPADAATQMPSGLSFADLADIVLASPIIADATITRATRLRPADSPGLAAGRARFYLEADVAALVRGAAGLSTRIETVADVPLDARGRPPKLKKLRVLILGSAVPGKPATVRLASPDAMLVWSAAADARIRTLARAAVAADAPPRITGIANAFHVPGSLPGESETQIFLTTADRRPVSLTIQRRPGEQPRWAVALSEMVDEAAAPPARDTLLWYRLACFLPATLPDTAVAELGAPEREAARADYRFVRAAIGACGRTRPPAGPGA